MMTDDHEMPKTILRSFSTVMQDLIKRKTCGNVEHPENSDQVEVKRDLPYTNYYGNEFAMNVYYPKKKTTATLPVIIMIHGGGLIVGDKEIDHGICEKFAQRGFLVLVPEYRLCAQTDIFGEVTDLYAGLEKAIDQIGVFGGDISKVSMVAESAGAYLSILNLGILRSENYRHIFNCRPIALTIRKLVCLSGMFYVTKSDLIGFTYPATLFGELRHDQKLMSYMNLDHPEILSLLPPVLMTTSKADFLRKYTISYADEIRKSGKSCEVLDYTSSKEATHAFPAIKPNLPESIDAIEKITAWLLD